MIGNDINIAKKYLEVGKLVAIPTETVYGLAANALDINAVVSIFETKKRPKFDPLIVHIKNINEVEKFAKDFPLPLQKLAIAFWPGALSILLEKREIIPDLVTSGLEKVALRVPNHPITQKLLNSLSFPLAAPSANPFGYVSPTTAQHVKDQFDTEIPYILDGGPCAIGLESTIVGLENDKIVIYRKGGVTIEEIQNVCDLEVSINAFSDSNPIAPGMLKKHYAPNKHIYSIDKVDQISELDKVGFLRFNNYFENFSHENQFILSPNSDLELAAKQLFEGLRWLDSRPIHTIFVEFVPNIGLGMAINDKLSRAIAQ